MVAEIISQESEDFIFEKNQVIILSNVSVSVPSSHSGRESEMR